MLLYLDQAYERFQREGRMRDESDLRAAVEEGAVQRIRPKMMAVTAILMASCRSCGATEPAPMS